MSRVTTKTFRLSKVSNPFDSLPESSRSEDFEFKVVDLTAEQAEFLMASNSEANRNIRPMHLQKLTKDMLEGRWEPIHQAICLDSSDVVIDGQHRLLALIAAEEENSGDPITIPVVIVKQKTARLHAPMDTGASRTATFVTGLSKLQIATINSLLFCEAGGFTSTATAGLAIEVYEKYRNEFVELDRLLPKKNRVGGFFAALIWMLPVAKVAGVTVGRGTEDLIDFASKCLTGEQLSQGDPAMAWRNWREKPLQQGSSYSWSIMNATFSCARYHMLRRKMHGVYSHSQKPGVPWTRAFGAWTTLRRQLSFSAPDTSIVRSSSFEIDD